MGAANNNQSPSDGSNVEVTSAGRRARQGKNQKTPTLHKEPNMRNNIWTTILVCAVFTVSCALCAVGAPNAEEIAKLKSADTNGDNKLTPEEFTAAFPEAGKSGFNKRDRNGDGFISREDFASADSSEAPANPANPIAPRMRVKALLQEADKDGNREVTFEEIAAVAPQVSRERFKTLDRNNDGVISQADRNVGGPAKFDLPKLFAKADTNSDKQITFEELQAKMPKLTKERFAQLDQNGDGILNQADRAASAPAGAEGRRPDRAAIVPKMLQADTNGDKQITFEELQAKMPKLTKERFAQLDQNGDGILSQADRAATAPAGAEGRRPDRAAIVHKMLQADSNGDKKVTYEEATAMKPGFPRAAFDRFDANGDGVLSQEDCGERCEKQE